MKKLIIILFLGLVACNYDKVPDWEFNGESDVTPNAFIENFRPLVGASPQEFMDNYIVKGTVITHEGAGNFYKSIIIDDGTAGLEIMVGLYNLDDIYPLGSVLVVKCKGLFLGEENSVLQLGEDGVSSVNYLSHKYIASKYITLTSDKLSPSLTELEISELSPAYCGRLVKLSDVYTTESDSTSWASYSSWTQFYSDTYREFSDYNSNTVKVLTSAYADFAGDYMPSGEVDICGVLFYDSAEGYYIKLRDLNDITLH
ncbi:MAG: DUF5689 domain-containing protein [Rikenellaceae bacterium]